ncbi:MAG: hypothetical protein WCS42_02290 [Verrucomicrobiota bacterium]
MKTNPLIAILGAVLCAFPILSIRAEELNPGRVSTSIELSAGTFTLSFDNDGRPAACHRKTDGAEFLRADNGGQGFYLKAPDNAPVPLNKLSLQPDGRLSARSDDGTKEVVFRVTQGQRNLALRIESVVGVPPERLEELHFAMNSDPRLRVLDLDYMTQADNEEQGVRVAWPAFWHRSPQDPLGGFAIYEKTDDNDEDATLLQLWVEEKLPHPKATNSWTVERARQWIADWQHRFANRDQLMLAGKSIAELHEGVEFARRAGLKQIYLFTDTWRTDAFWAVTDLNWGVNRAVFPRGETDLREFSDFVRGQGMYLALHYVSGGIGLRDPIFVGQKPDRRFASWGGGRLAHEVGAADTTLIFQPDTGVVPPEQRRPAYPHFFEWNLLRVGDELVRIGTIEVGTNGAWTLKKCQRGQGSTKAIAHKPKEDAAGLLVAYGQNLVPDNDSTLLDEVAQNYSGLLNRCVVDHAEFDGAEIHAQEGRWGYRKFATRVYEALDHPTTAHDSGGTHPASWFEYRLNSSRRLMRGSCAYTHGNYSVPVTLATPSRPATTLLDAQFMLSQGNYGGALGISKPEPMFGVTPQVLKTHGLTDQFVDALKTWNEVSALLTDKQREQINATFSQPKGAAAQFNRHLRSPVVPVARKADDHYEIVPTRVLIRKTGDILWQNGQEHGAISPRQFIKPGEKLSLENPDSAQPLQFIIHILPGFKPQERAERVKTGSNSDARTATEFFVEGNDAAAAPSESAPTGNVLLQPANIQAIHAAGDTTVKLERDALVLTATNPNRLQRRETEKFPSWNVTLDMTRRRGLGMWLTGDNSGALLLVKLARRDYVVPIDFSGRRYVEIPNGEVSWASSDWGWRMETKSADYSKVRTVQIGFGQLPPGGNANVKVEQLTALGEIPVTLRNPVVHIGSGQLRVQGDVGSGQFLQYTGGDKATLYDANWHQLGELPVEKNNYIMPTGQGTITVTSEQIEPAPWLDVQFITTGTPMMLKNK